jgi:CheY-like chemotaxis protein
MNGMEVAKWVRKESNASSLPIVMLSGSGLKKDIDEAYDAGINSHFRKPSSVGALAALLKSITTYWQLTERPDLEANRGNAAKLF